MPDLQDQWIQWSINWSFNQLIASIIKTPSWSLAYQYLFVSHPVNQCSSEMCYRFRVGLGRAAELLGLVIQGQLLSEWLRLSLSGFCSLEGEEEKLKENQLVEILTLWSTSLMVNSVLLCNLLLWCRHNSRFCTIFAKYMAEFTTLHTLGDWHSKRQSNWRNKVFQYTIFLYPLTVCLSRKGNQPPSSINKYILLSGGGQREWKLSVERRQRGDFSLIEILN